MTPSTTPVEVKRPTTVALWTPWGVQSVPKQDFRAAAVKRMAERLASARKAPEAKSIRA